MIINKYQVNNDLGYIQFEFTKEGFEKAEEYAKEIQSEVIVIQIDINEKGID